MGVEKRLRSILTIKNRDEQEVALRTFAESIGCSVDSTYIHSGDVSKHDTPEVIRRIREAARSQREEQLWVVAVLSAVASIISALAAWCAVLLKT